ncbi:MAG: trypsin-like peptidase domain-containing protein, partial [Spirochaetales bacterium]
MKLYSRRDMAIGIAAGTLAVIALVGGLSFLIAKSGIFGTSQAKNLSQFSSQSSNDSSPALAAEAKNESNAASSSVASEYTTQSGQSYTQDERENINVYEKYNESVVNITTEVVNVNWFLEPVPQSGGSGSGSIIDSRGYILTNYHVVKGAYKLFVNLADGSQYEASVVGFDSQNDLAIIKFTPPAGAKLLPIPFGTSRGLKVGQKVLAIGNPFGLERTLTQGIVSGLGRPIQKDDTTILQNMIQTDASINPGNSGGPLFNSSGRMIGINTMIYSPSGGSVGIGFAIPVDTAIRIVPELIKDGKVRRGWIEM